MEVIPVAIDLETTANGYKGSPKACYKGNKILACGIHNNTHIEVPSCTWYWSQTREELLKRFENLVDLNKKYQVILIGHNFKFDLSYLLRDFPEIPWHEFTIWDTAEVHYLQSGHIDKFPSLEDVALFNGWGYTKYIDVGDWLAKGNKMQSIPEADLRQYVYEDAKVTYSIYISQTNSKASSKHEFEVCGKLVALASIELNGMCVDDVILGNGILSMEAELTSIEADLRRYYKVQCSLTDDQVNKLNLTANRTVSSYLCGVPAKVPVGSRKADKEELDIGNGGKGWCCKPHDGWPGEKPNKNTGFSVSESKLREIQATFPERGSRNYEYIDMILRHRELNKILNTYFTKLLQISRFTGSKIYTNINTTKTATGRTSSDSPNFQNMPPEVRKVFCARKVGSTIVEIDFKQLELCAIADLSQDWQMIEDITNGVDIHYEIGKDIFGWVDPSDMNEVDRRTVKTVVFGLCYGGGAKTLAVQAGIPTNLASDIIGQFYRRYPGVKQWHETLILEVNEAATPCGKAGYDGTQIQSAAYTVPKTGRWYLYTEVEAPDWLKRRGTTYSFSPTVLKNYPAQGFAGGDIVMTFLTVLYDLLKERNMLTLLVNTIHDSIVAEVPDEEMEQFKEVVKIAQNYTTEYWELSVPLTVEVKSSGFYWK